MNVRLGTRADLPAYCAIWNVVWPENKENLAFLERQEEILPEEKRTTFWLAEKDGVPVGFLDCNRNDGSYHPLKWFGGIGVIPAHRGEGIGSALWDIALRFLAEREAISLTTRISDQDEDSIRFATSRGFQESKRDFESALYPDKLDPSSLEQMATSEADIVPAAELDSPEFRRDMHLVFEEVRKDTPRAAPPTPMSFEEFEEQILNDPDFLWAASHIAIVDGKVVGFSCLYETGQPKELFQWLTGVLRPYRGKKIAQALKAHSARWTIANGYRKIRTDNDTRNAAMLAINERMGYERLFGMITMVKRFGDEAPQ